MLQSLKGRTPAESFWTAGLTSKKFLCATRVSNLEPSGWDASALTLRLSVSPVASVYTWVPPPVHLEQSTSVFHRLSVQTAPTAAPDKTTWIMDVTCQLSRQWGLMRDRGALSGEIKFFFLFDDTRTGVKTTLTTTQSLSYSWNIELLKYRCQNMSGEALLQQLVNKEGSSTSLEMSE